MKRILLFISLSISGFAVTAQPAGGLVGFFNFNGNTTNTGSAGITASTVNVVYGTNPAGSPNRAIQFSGTTSSYVTVTDNGNLDFAGDFSVSFGIFIPSLATNQGFYDNGLNYGGCGIWYFSSDNSLRFNFKNGSLGAVNALTANQWKVVCAVRSGSTLRLYVDGVQVASGPEGASAITYPYAPVLGQMYFAGTGGNYNPAANGSKIDEIRFYNRALSAAEVLSLTAFTLPLQFIEFNGRMTNNTAVLKWKTTNELNTLSFDIERSINGRDYITAGDVPAFNTPGDHQYSFTDNYMTGTPVVYYRLKQKDTDGKITYSETVALSFDISETKIGLYPNPVLTEANVTVTGNKSEKAEMKITDQAGRTVKRQLLNISAGTNSFPIDISRLGKGMYFLEIKGNTINERRPFVKQ